MPYINFRKIKNGPPCPLCGSDTVRRQSKFGGFWGCIWFSNCLGFVSSTRVQDAVNAMFFRIIRDHAYYSPNDDWFEPRGIDDTSGFGMPQEWFD